MMRSSGRISFWNRKGGYGFIESPAGLHFAHIEEFRKVGPICEDQLVKGASVLFTHNPAESSQTRPRAYDIQLEGH